MKIAIIGNSHYRSIGGIETYHRQLIKFLLSEGHEILSFHSSNASLKSFVSQEIKNKNFKHESCSGLFDCYLFKTKKKIIELINDDSVDLIITNLRTLNHKKIANSNKVLLIQHVDWIGGGPNKNKLIAIKWFLDSYFLRLSEFIHPFINFKNKVFFSKYNNHNVNDFSSFYIPLAIPQNIKINTAYAPKGKTPCWLGRYTKNKLDLLIKVANLYDKKINIYGNGKYKKIEKQKNIVPNGFITRDNISKELLKNKYYLMTSHEEGFSFTLLEALANGLPIIAFDTFDSIKIFKDSKAVFTFSKNDISGFVKKMKELDSISDKEYQSLSAEAKKFAQNFSIEKINKKWKKVIYEMARR